MAFEIDHFPSDWGNAASTARFLIGGVFGGEANSRANLACAAWNLAGFALGQALGQPSGDAGVVVFRFTEALHAEATPILSMPELRTALETVAELEGADGTTQAAKQIPWLKLALALAKLFAPFAGDDE